MRARHAWFLAAAVLAVALPADAQEPDPAPLSPARDDELESIDSITVTITRRAMGIQEVNSLVTAFDEETLRSANIDNQEDVVELMPNVTTKGGRFNSISVRGLSSGISNQEAVALHTNGVFTGPGSFFDIESVQFDRGPSGSLYGRNATAGALNVSWKKPQPEWAAWGELDLANYDQFRIRSGVNVPLLGAGDDRLMLRLNVQRNKYDGWLDNEFETRQEDPGNGDEYTISGTLRSVLSEDLEGSIRFRYSKLRNDVTPSRPLIDRYPSGFLPSTGQIASFGLPIRSDPYNGLVDMVADLATGLPNAIDAQTGVAGLGNIIILTTSAGLGITQQEAREFILLNGTTFAGNVIPPILPLILQDPSVIGTAALPLPSKIENVRSSVGSRGEPEIVRWGIDGEVKWSGQDLPLLGDVDFKLAGGVFQTDLKVLLDLDGTELRILDVDRRTRTQRWTGEVQAVSKNDAAFNWVAGFFFFQDRTEGNQLIVTLFEDLPEVTGSRTRGVAPFAHFYYDWSEQLQFEVGIRWSRDVSENNVFRQSAGLVQPEDVTINPRQVFRERTGDFIVRWNFSDESAVYAKYVRGYRPGGLNTGRGVQDVGSAEFRSFEPEAIDAYEIGSKNSLFDGLFTFNAAAFWYRYKNLQVPVVTVSGVFTQNAAAATIRGVELEAQIPFRSPIDFFEGGLIAASMGYLHAEYDELCADDPFQFSAVSDPKCPAATNSFDAQNDLSSHHLPDAPRWTASIMAVLNKDLGEIGSLRFVVRSKFTDDYYLRPENLNEIDLVPNSTRTDVRIIWQSADERFSVHVYGENLEGRFQFASTLVGPEITGGLPVGLVIPLTPRKYGVQLEWKFGAN